MCGIVGYIGKKKAAPILLDGLKRLEYRGYDSAGLVLVSADGRADLTREVGRVGNLEKTLAKKGALKDRAGLGIAHTRWATHGKPSTENSHPHSDCNGGIFVVHNGIIENYKELKNGLLKRGHKFRSETDTEVLAHLIEENYRSQKGGHRLLRVVEASLKDVRGTYGIAVVSASEPDKIIASRVSSPLLIGIGKNENVVASDASVVLGHTKKVVYLEDGEVAEVTAKNFHIETLGATAVKRAPQTLEMEITEAGKAGHDHFMHKEIFEAPETVLNSSRGRLLIKEGKAKLGGIESIKEKLKTIERLVIVGCGTASYAAYIGEYMLEEYAGIPVEVDIGSEFRYRHPVLDEHTALIAISQSGETADTLAAIKEAKQKGALTIGIVNVVGSTIARESGVGIYNHAGPEISVASTKAFISQLTVLALLAMYIGRERGTMSATTGKKIARELERLPAHLREVLTQEDAIKKIAKKHRRAEHVFFLGRKYSYPMALEGALKLKEVSYVHAEGCAAGEFKHGPIAMVTPHVPSFFLAPVDTVYEKTKSNLEEVKARGGPIIALTTRGNRELKAWTDDIIYIPKTIELLTPILAAVPLYLFAYHLAVLNGNDVDKPRNLAKSVTVE